MNEKDLIEGCKVNDNYARKEFVLGFSRQMMGVCYRYVGNKELAMDLLHDGFLKIFQSFHLFEYRGEGSLKAWVSRIFTNLSLEYLRQHGNYALLPLDEWDGAEELAEEDNLELISNDTLMSFVQELPVGYKTVFNLYVFDGMSHKTIAEMLGINEVSSRSQLSRAKKVLAEKIRYYIRENE